MSPMPQNLFSVPIPKYCVDFAANMLSGTGDTEMNQTAIAPCKACFPAQNRCSVNRGHCWLLLFSKPS